MNTYGVVLPKGNYLSSFGRRINISKEEKKRLSWFDHYRKTSNARLACRYFGISPQTFYRWKKRYNPYDLSTLESRPSRPLRIRKPQIPSEVEDRINRLRRQYPRWGRFLAKWTACCPVLLPISNTSLSLRKASFKT